MKKWWTFSIIKLEFEERNLGGGSLQLSHLWGRGKKGFPFYDPLNGFAIWLTVEGWDFSQSVDNLLK